MRRGGIKGSRCFGAHYCSPLVISQRITVSEREWGALLESAESLVLVGASSWRLLWLSVWALLLLLALLWESVWEWATAQVPLCF